MTLAAILGDGLLARSIHDVRPDWPMLSHQDFDIEDWDSIVSALTPIKPQVAINTVALHRFADCEQSPERAMRINARGAERVASILPTVYVSTDYVFHDRGPHDESLPGRQPRNAYGRSKLAGELATLEYDGIVVRVAGLYGLHKSHKGLTFPEQVLSMPREVLRVPNDQQFSPTYAPDAAARIAERAEALAAHEAHGVYHATNGGSTTWEQFAHMVAAMRRFPRKVEGFAAHDPLRPTDSRLVSTRLPPLRNWIIALQEWAERWRPFDTVSPLRQ